jgi:hypothetical protein
MTAGEETEETFEAPKPLFRLGEYHVAGTRFIAETLEALAAPDRAGRRDARACRSSR